MGRQYRKNVKSRIPMYNMLISEFYGEKPFAFVVCRECKQQDGKSWGTPCPKCDGSCFTCVVPSTEGGQVQTRRLEASPSLSSNVIFWSVLSLPLILLLLFFCRRFTAPRRPARKLYTHRRPSQMPPVSVPAALDMV